MDRRAPNGSVTGRARSGVGDRGSFAPDQDQPPEGRDQGAEGRDLAADDRDRAAEGQDQGAEGRDLAADDRDRAATRRDQAADDRDRAAEVDAESGSADSADSGHHSASDRREAAFDRAMALEDRREGASDREQAEGDRSAAGGDRDASAGDRGEATRDALNLAAIMESSGIVVFGSSLDGVILSWSGGAQKLYGYTAGEAVGQSVSILSPHDRPDEAPEILSEIRQGRTVSPFETVRLHKRGKSIDVSVIIVPILDSAGEVTGAASIHRDIGDRSRQVKLVSAHRGAVEASRLKSEFLADMSHEIRTSMNGVIGLTRLLLETELTAAQREYADGVRTSGDALLRIINDILDLSKIEADKFVLRVVDFDVNEVLDEVASLVAPDARQKGIDLLTFIESGVVSALRGDVGRVRQILLNLASNAVKYTQEGKVAIRAEMAGAGKEGPVSLRFEVSDTGPGIASGDRVRIFEPFLQSEAATTRRTGGTGLGLALCKRLTEAMGGAIGFNSVEGQGSTFWVILPFKRALEEHARKLTEPTHLNQIPERRGAGVEAGDRGYLLVVDDNRIAQTVATGILDHMGYLSDVAADGIEALEALSRRNYDAVFMDCHMPRMDGFEATAEIRRREGRRRHTPVIAMTASALAEEHLPCRQAGMDGYIAKPATPEQIEAVLGKWIGAATGASPPVGRDLSGER